MSFRCIPEFPGEGKREFIWKMAVSDLILPYSSAYMVAHQQWLGPESVSRQKNKEPMHSEIFSFQVTSRKCVYLMDLHLIPRPWSVFTLLRYIQSSPFGRFWKILGKECQSQASAAWKTALKESFHRTSQALHLIYRHFPFLFSPQMDTITLFTRLASG